MVRSGLSTISAWGTAGKAKVSATTYAIFTNWVTDPRTEVRPMSLDEPKRLSTPVEVYRFDDVSQATVILDEESRTWFMYYRGEDLYGVKLAPAGTLDNTPPTSPRNVLVDVESDRNVNISWTPATDSETGIAAYNIFRDGVSIGTLTGWEFNDSSLTEQTEYSYQVSPVNYHGVEGPRSEPLSVTKQFD